MYSNIQDYQTVICDFPNGKSIRTGDKSGDVILKVLNASTKAIKTQIDLKDAKYLTEKWKAIVLTSASTLDENTLEGPKKVYSKTEDVKFIGTYCKRTFPRNSLTVIRLSTKR